MRLGRLVSVIWVSLAVVTVAACGSDPEPLFEPREECVGDSITPLAGQHQQVISFLEIGDLEDGFDLDRDGEPDNKLAAVGSLASSAIDDSFEDFSIIIPIEFFDFATPGVDECVKFALYLGIYTLDEDGDDDKTADNRGDCNDHDENINKDVAEVADNFKDDNCDGNADEMIVVDASDAGVNETLVLSDDTMDRDEDGVTMADGDCDDTDDTVGGVAEICGDGLDNDCDGNADYPDCNPYDDTPDRLELDPLAFNSDGTPVIQFSAGTVAMGPTGVLDLEAGPSLFSVNIPVTDDLNLDLRITGATIEAEIVPDGNGGFSIDNGRLGGVIDANTADLVRGLEVEEIGLNPEDSLLDAIFANILGPILALPSLPDSHEYAGCRLPDIDVDQDGLEAFCDSDPLDEKQTVDVCIDGNGSIVFDEVDAQGEVTRNCTEVLDDSGKLRFVDGISVEINFETVPTILPEQLPPL